MPPFRPRLIPYWECEQCQTRHYHAVIDLGNVVCECGVGKGLWFAVPNPESRMPFYRGGPVRSLVIALMLTVCAWSQEPKRTPDGPLKFSWYAVGPEMAPMKAAFSAHDLALANIKEFNDYELAKGLHQSGSIIIVRPHVGEEQSVSMDEDGTIKLKNMTIEDAFLLLWGARAQEMLWEMQRWDKFEAKIEAAKKDVPPNRVRLGKEKWNIENIPDWSQGKYLGQTFCGMGKIKLLETNSEKQETMMHEMMHVVSGCKDNPELHSLITELSPGLVKLLQQNPDLVKYLTKTKPVAAQHK